jgi:alpha-tubulin suppressor-like RCC1 family protein
MKSLLSWFILLVSITLLVSSCASSDDSTTTASNDGATGGSGGSGSLPYFTGTPPTTAFQATAYSFTPTITNTANDNISFTMLNQPSWMNVDNSTGVISGTPGSIVVGTTATDLFYMLVGPRHINGRNFSVKVTAPEINATSISAGGGLTCALDNSSGMVKCWGRGNYLGLGDTNNRGDGANEMGSNLAFVELGTGRTATAIFSGQYHNCALLDNASVKCWGYNNYGQLGQGNNNDLGDGANEMGDNLPSIDLGTGRTATAISTGGFQTCALLDNASVKCWGYNNYGQLGQGNTNNLGDGANEMGDNLPSIDLGTGRTATAIAQGYSHTCVLLDNASVKCWGYGNYGQLGQGNKNSLGDGANEMGDNLTSIDLGTGRTATAISAGHQHTCALLDNASVKCWGQGSNGKLGQGNTTTLGDGANEMGDNLTSIDLGTGRTATAISAGQNYTCALLDNASVKCWGSNNNGQLGQGNTNNLGDGANEMGDNLTSIDLGTGRTATAISASSADHTCVLLDNSAVKCWGYNHAGQLGQGNTNTIGDDSNEMGDNLPAIDL